MDKEDLPSDSDESDEDFRPDGNDSDIPSEEESDYAGSSDDNNDETEPKKTPLKKRHKKKSSGSKPVIVEEPAEVETTGISNEDAEKKRADALWANFLSDTPDIPSPRPPSKQNGTGSQQRATTSASTKTSTHVPPPKPEPEKVKITEIFEFAGEEVRVTKEVDATEALPAASNLRKFPPTARLSAGGIKRPAVGGGLSSILGQINKKNKITVLEKTKLDWDSFKSNEGLSEELQTFNKGKDGYLERQDFLQRTDLRQFEQEKNLRQTSKRSNR